jgi:hypothetical protein
MRYASTLMVVGLFVAVTVLCALGGTIGSAFAHDQDGERHHSSPCSALSGCQAESPSEWGAGIPRLKCDGPLAVSPVPRLPFLIPQIIDHPPESSA